MPEQRPLVPSNRSGEKPSQEKEVVQLQQASETFMAHAMQIMSANSYTPTQAQVDKMLSLQEKGMDYTHRERTHFSPQLISSLIVFGALIFVLIGLFVFCVFFAPEYASQIITGALGVITGAFGGYGYGVRSRKENQEE